MTMNKDQFMIALKTRLKDGNIIGKAAFDKVQIIIGDLNLIPHFKRSLEI